MPVVAILLEKIMTRERRLYDSGALGLNSDALGLNSGASPTKTPPLSFPERRALRGRDLVPLVAVDQPAWRFHLQ